jgi:UDP-N-acetylglucosamine 1-carboxyvinyltransferase
MGAKIKLINNHVAEIEGPTKLSGANIASLDIRAGATLIIAGLIAKGRTQISQAENIDRGYEKIEERLQKLGAKIRRIP